MKRFTRWGIVVFCILAVGYAALLVLIYTLHLPQDFRQLRNGMTQKEVNDLLGGEPNLPVRKEEPDNLQIIRTPPDIQELVADNLHLFQLGNNKLAAGQSYQLWD